MIRFCEKIQDENVVLLEESVVFQENIFCEVHKIIEKKIVEDKQIYIKVVNGGEIKYCYDDQRNKGMYLFYQETVNRLINSKLSRDVLLKRLNRKQVKAFNILDMNELSLNIYKLCVRKGIPVFVRGRGWNILKENNSENENSYPQNEWLYIYAEGRRNVNEREKIVIDEEFSFLAGMGIGIGARNYLLTAIKEYVKKDINTIIVSIPNKNQISDVTEEQRICKDYPPFQAPDEVKERIFGSENIEFFRGNGNRLIDMSLNQYLFSGGGGFRYINTKERMEKKEYM